MEKLKKVFFLFSFESRRVLSLEEHYSQLVNKHRAIIVIKAAETLRLACFVIYVNIQSN